METVTRRNKIVAYGVSLVLTRAVGWKEAEEDGQENL
jgi:hypothetical protein